MRPRKKPAQARRTATGDASSSASSSPSSSWCSPSPARVARLLRRLAVVRRGRLPLRVLDALLVAAAGRRSRRSPSSSSSSWLNVELARRLAPSYRVNAAGDLLEPRSEAVRKWVGIGGLGVSLLAAVIAGVSPPAQWQTFLLYVKQAPFGEKDVDLRPRHRLLRVLAADVAGAAELRLRRARRGARPRRHHAPHHGRHRLQGDARPGAAPGRRGRRRRGRRPASPFARAQRAAAPQLPQIDVKLGGRAVAHLSAILAAIFVVVGVGQLFRGWNLLYSTAGAIYGAGYTDVHIRLPLTYVTMVIALLLAAVLVWNIWRRHQWWPAVIVVWVVVRHRAARRRAGGVPVAHRQPQPAHQGARVHRPQPGGHQERLQAQRHHAAAALGQDAAHAAEAQGQPAHAEQHPPVGPQHPGDELPAAAGAAAVLRRSSTPTWTATP